MCSVVVAQREQPGVELRVQRLDAAAHDLREAREVLDRADLEPALAQRRGGAAGGDELDAQLRQPAGEVDDPRLVRDRQQRALHAHLARLRHAIASIEARTIPAHGASTSTRRGWAGSSRTAPRAISAHRLGQQFVLERAQRRRAPRPRRGRVRQLDRALEDDRPGVDALVDEVDGDAEDLHPVRRAPARPRAMPGNAGSSAGCTLITRCGKRARNAGRRAAACSRRARRARRRAREPVGHRDVARLAVGVLGRREDARSRRPPRARPLERLRARLVRADRDDVAPRGRGRGRGSPAGSCPRPRRAPRRATALTPTASFGKRPPVERSVPAASSASTRPSTSSARRSR